MNAPTTLDPKLPRMTADEFLAWAEEQPVGRFELLRGEVFAMSPERAGHVVAKLGVVLALIAAVREARADCQVMTDGMAVRIDDATVYEPDALIRPNPPLPMDALTTSDPLLVVEVLSPSTRRIDERVKLVGYFKLPSLHHYLIVDPVHRLAVHHRRAGEDRLDTRVHEAPADGPGPEIRLDPPGLLLAVADLFKAPGS